PILQAGQILGLKARQPEVDGGSRDLQKLTDTPLAPALRIQGNDLQTGGGGRGMAVVVEQRPRRGGRRETVPEATRRLAGEPMHSGMKDDPGQFAVPESLVEAFQPLE